MTDYFDGPLGIADFERQPHAYLRRFDEQADDYTREFILWSLAATTLELAMEAGEVWQRFNSDYGRGEASPEVVPSGAISAERDRALELEQLLGDRLTTAPANGSFLAVPKFRPRGGPWCGPSTEVVDVEWTRVDSERSSSR